MLSSLTIALFHRMKTKRRRRVAGKARRREEVDVETAVRSETVGPPFSFHRRHVPPEKAQAYVKGVVDGVAKKFIVQVSFYESKQFASIMETVRKELEDGTITTKQAAIDRAKELVNTENKYGDFAD